MSRWGPFLIAGALFFASLVFELATEGGWDYACFYGPVSFVFLFPILLLAGRLLGSLVGRFRPPRPGVSRAISLLPVLALSTLLASEGFRLQDPAARFEQRFGSPLPAGVRVRAAFTYEGFNFSVWSFHITLAPEDLPWVLAQRPFTHEVDPDGFDWSRNSGLVWRSRGAVAPPPGFKAVHRYSYSEPAPRGGSSVVLYGSARQDDFYVYGQFD